MKLCYIQGCWAYFTSQDLKKQDGEDWHKKPYEAVSLPPDEPRSEFIMPKRGKQGDFVRDERGGLVFDKGSDYENGVPKWTIRKLAFEDEHLFTPADLSFHSSYSVYDINDLKVPWLTDRDSGEEIWAGTSLDDFILTIQSRRGKIYTCIE